VGRGGEGGGSRIIGVQAYMHDDSRSFCWSLTLNSSLLALLLMVTNGHSIIHAHVGLLDVR
jgi:hypothetical protein